MSSNKCPKCFKDLSPEAVICKFCGTELKTKNKNWFQKHKILSVVIGLFSFFIIIGIIGSMNDGAPKSAPAATTSNSQKPEVTTTTKTAATTSSETADKKVVFPVDIVSPNITTNEIGDPELNVTIKNNSKKTIDAIEIISSFTNNFGEDVKNIYDFDTDTDKFFKGSSQEKIAAGSSKHVVWNLTGFDGAKKIKDIYVYRVHFSDGETISK